VAGEGNQPHGGRSRGASLAIVVVAYAVAIGVGWGVAVALRDHHPLWSAFVADLAATVVIFASSMLVGNSSMYDAYWSVAPPLLGVWFVAEAVPGANGARQVIVMVGVLVWAVRLTSNWVRDWPGLAHEDWRYANMRASSPTPWPVTSFVGIHLFPTLQVFLGCIALWPALGASTASLGALDVVAVAVMIGGASLEFVADEQMRRFRKVKQPGQIMRSGLWSRCRHPNYLGELLFWVGVWIAAMAADVSWWWTVAGPAAMLAMFVGASIPMLDTRSVESRPGYDEIVATLPALLPLGPRRRA
jgi:steroid 5-alpha reductase family enzyme